MKKVAILGCENSHADNFLKSSVTDKMFADDIEIVGVFSEYEGAAERLHEIYGVPVMQSYDELVGKADAIMITARHGKNHYKYAAPYIKSGIPMFIDKPITVDCDEAIAFMKEAKAHGVTVTGGSSCVHAALVKELAQAVKSSEPGDIYGGYLRAPVSIDNEYGGFWFYSQHLVQVMCSIFGYYPKSVMAFTNRPLINITVRYESFDVNIVFTEGNYLYYASVSSKSGVVGDVYSLDTVFETEFEEFHSLVMTGEQAQSYSDFIAPVFVLDAIKRSIDSGKEEEVRRFEEI